MVQATRSFIDRTFHKAAVPTSLGITKTVSSGPQYIVGPKDKTILVDDDKAAVAVRVVLPAAVNNKNREIRVKKLGSTAAVTVDGNGSELIDESTTQIMTGQYDAMHLVCDGVEWWII